MKKIAFNFFVMLLLTLLIPAIIILIFSAAPNNSGGGEIIKALNTVTGEIMEVNIEDYLPGVLSAEMPASFPLEALKAQAVAARTYIINRKINKEMAEEHKGADICTDFTHCKAWISKADALARWNEVDRQKYWDKMLLATAETKGQIMLYDAKPVSALFYAISSGKTENAKDVWGNDVPYLKSVASSLDVNAPGFESKAEFSSEDFKNKILEDTNINFTEAPESWIGEITNTEGGAVDTLLICGHPFKGTKIRAIFELRSANFTLEFKDNLFTFHVKGYGHGVGMSQWGAKFLADEGKNYVDILKTYYKDIEISTSQLPE